MAAVIEVDNLVKRYDGRTVVDGISFQVDKGEIFAILGPNGAGKTTTVESIAGLRRPDDSAVRVLGLDPGADAAELRQRVGIQLQESRFAGRVRVGELLEVLPLVASGATNRDAAERLFISEATVKSHLLHIYAKLGVGDRAAAVGAAFDRGLLTPGDPGR
ncbi:MAG: ATP-binding cassette domain-containing protein [Acidimicrobiia bacterium]